MGKGYSRRCWAWFAVVASLVAATATSPANATSSRSLVADWEMNEPHNARVMSDSTKNDNDGTIPSGTAITTGNSDSSAPSGFYRWSNHCPACAPADPSRVISVPDAANGSLDIPDPQQTYTLVFRFRTTHGFGNFMQKGQSTTRGGQIKVQAPKGNVQCLFKGADGVRVGTGWGAQKPPLDDGQWHTVTCVHTATQVREYVDNFPKPVIKNGVTGPIDNRSPMTIGGKLNCDQVSTTCDYFSGDMDFVKIYRG
jgi:Concanavalin A-like lectin/glucanases superfamily